MTAGNSETDVDKWFDEADGKMVDVMDEVVGGKTMRTITCSSVRTMEKANDKDFDIVEEGTFDYAF